MYFKNLNELWIGGYELKRLVSVSDGLVLFEKKQKRLVPPVSTFCGLDDQSPKSHEPRQWWDGIATMPTNDLPLSPQLFD